MPVTDLHALTTSSSLWMNVYRKTSTDQASKTLSSRKFPNRASIVNRVGGTTIHPLGIHHVANPIHTIPVNLFPTTFTSVGSKSSVYAWTLVRAGQSLSRQRGPVHVDRVKKLLFFHANRVESFVQRETRQSWVGRPRDTGAK